MTGLTRVRKFHQDDAHIFCTSEQVESEIMSTLKFIERVYTIFQFPEYHFKLSTRPDNYIGNVEDWDRAENALTNALNAAEKPWTLNQGDGAFYGPKIDIHVRDTLGRSHQTATIQLDFQLPQRFQLEYTDANGKFHTPVIIHRAVLGSLERILAILIEHTNGRWPFWLSPRQIMVIPISDDCIPYAKEMQKSLSVGSPIPISSTAQEIYHHERPYYYVDLDVSDKTLSKKVREAQLLQYNTIVIIGEREVMAKTLSVRWRDGKVETQTLESLVDTMRKLTESFQ